LPGKDGILGTVCNNGGVKQSSESYVLKAAESVLVLLNIFTMVGGRMDGSRGSIQRFKMDKHQEAKKKAPIGAHLQKNHISDPNDLLIIVQL